LPSTTFVQNYERQVTVADILDNGDIDKTADFAINEHTALVDKMEASEVFAGELTGEQVTNLATYFLTLPSEVAMKLWTVLGAGDTAEYHQSASGAGRRSVRLWLPRRVAHRRRAVKATISGGCEISRNPLISLRARAKKVLDFSGQPDIIVVESEGNNDTRRPRNL
jgi:hypothetical protein